ncbi:MAG: LamG-like jellyroll fold domain-containing protein [Candidatus Micrarchaeia archaeon]
MYNKGKTRGKAQITLEFLIAYSLVLLIFLIIFALIATQRASTLASQDYSSMQLISQTVSTAIDTALASGNGYSATIPLPSAISTQPYNLSLSSTGVVIAGMQIGKETVSAQAFSNARNLVINGTVIATGNGVTLYSLPAYKGTIYIANSKGTIYIDEQPVSTLALAGTLQANATFIGKAAEFSGNNSYIVAASTVNTVSSGTFSAWVYSNGWVGNSRIIGSVNNVPTELLTNSPGVLAGYVEQGGVATVVSSGYTIPAEKWVLVTMTFGPSGIAFYVNGQSVYSSSTPTSGATSTPLLGWDSTSGTDFWDGLIANAQIYGTALSASQVQQLYQEGIGGAPVASASLLGWWPLNGNANDYSGNGNNGAPYKINYIGVAQITAQVKNENGASASGDLVGFTSTYGNFSGSGKGNFATYSNSSGVATAILDANTSSPSLANVTITAFNGNYSSEANIVGWWPLNIGAGSTAYDLSANYNNGDFSNYAWSSMENSTNFAVAEFPGDLAGVTGNNIEDGFVTINNTDIYSIPANRTFSIVAWIYYKGATANHCQGIFGDWPGPGPGFQLLGYGCAILSVNGSSISWPAGTSSFPKGAWEMVTAEYTARTGMASVYLNDSLFAMQQLPVSLSLVQKLPYYIGDDAWQGSGYDTFNGSIANVQLYSSFLTQAQITQLYKEGINGAPLNNADLVGWWLLNGNANDYSGNGNNGKINYNVSFVNQRFGMRNNYSIASFNGQNSYIQIPITPALSTNSFTWVLWMYPNTWQSNNAGIFGQANIGTGYPYMIEQGSPSSPLLQFSNDGGGSSSAYTPLLLNTMQNVAGVYNYTSGTISIYVNGRLIQSATSSPIARGSSPIYFGYFPTSGLYFDGFISNAQIYNTALSSSQIQQLYLQGLPQYKRLTIPLG